MEKQIKIDKKRLLTKINSLRKKRRDNFNIQIDRIIKEAQSIVDQPNNK